MKPARPTREHILAEIQRLAASSPDQAVGRDRFAKETGIKPTVWTKHWATWSEACTEAGVTPNTLTRALDRDDMLRQLAEVTRSLGRVPTYNQLRVEWHKQSEFPTPQTFQVRFGAKAQLNAALREWVERHPDFSDIAPLLPPPARAVELEPGPVAPEITVQPIVSDSFVPPIIAGLPSLARMEKALPIEFENRVATAFEVLGLEVQRLGQGSGREPDGIAKCREHGWAVVYDAKARTGPYRLLAPEERKFREYIKRYTHDLRREGMGRFYFALISSAFSENDLPRARELCHATDARAVALVEATALVKLVEQHVATSRTFTHEQLERAFSETRIVRETDIGDGTPLRPVHDLSPVSTDEPSTGRSTPRGNFETLMARWPDFEAKVKTFAEFFDYTLIYCLATPLQSSDGLDTAKPEDAALNGRREATLNGLGLLNRFAWELVRELNVRPRAEAEAKALLGRFQSLLAAPAVLRIEELYAELGPRSRQPAEFTSRLERLRLFKNDYESFARASNQHIGAEFFRPYVP